MMHGKSRALQAAILLALIIVFAFGDVVFLGRTLLASNMVAGTMPSGAYGYTGRRVSAFPVLDAGASAWDYEPDIKVLHDDLIQGWLPLWNPYVGSGAPFLANMFSGALSPLRLLVAAVEKPLFWDLYLIFRLFLAAFFTFLFARRIEIGFVGAIVAGIIFALSGHFILEVNMPDLDVQIWLPALLIVADRLVQKASYGRFMLTALLVALVILNGMPESALFVFLLAGVYFLVRAWPSGQAAGTRWAPFAKRAAYFTGAGVVGLLISLPLVLPFLEYLRHAFNPRAPGVGATHDDINTAVSIILPRFFGHIHQTWTGVSSFSILPYVGATCCLLALAALCQKGPLPRLTIFFSGFSLFYLLKAFGIPPVQWVSQLLLFNMSIFPKHAFPEFAFCLAILAGAGAEGLLTNKTNYLRFAVASVLLFLTVGVFAAYYWKVAIHAGALRSITRGCRAFAVDLLLVWILAWAARRLGPSRLVALGLILIPTAELTAFISRDRTNRYDAFTKPPFVDFLRTDPEIYRTFSADRFLYPDANAAFGIDDIRSLDPLQIQRYIDFLRKDVSPKVYDRFDGTEADNFLRSPLLDLMNVKYVLASSEIPENGLRDLSHDIASGKVRTVHAKLSLVYDHEVKIYKNNEALPRAFVVYQKEAIPDEDRILARLIQPDFDARKAVILEEKGSADSASTTAEQPNASPPVVFDRYEPNYVRLQASLAQPGWLVLADTYYPGWKVRVDGQRGRILPADYIFRAVSLEPGSHVVEFIYRPLSFLLGVAISALTIGILLLAPLVRRLRAPHRDAGQTCHTANHRVPETN